MKIFKANKPQKLSSFLLEKYNGELSYNTFMKLLRNKDVKLNNKRINFDAVLNVDDEVVVYYDGAKRINDFEVVFDSQDLIVVNKNQGITCEDFESLVKTKYPSARLVHRLDRNTCGLLIFALNEEGEEELLKAFKDRKIDKYYVCEVYGFMPNEKGVLIDYLVKDSQKSLVKIYNREVENSQKIITEYKVLSKKEKTSILEIKLITGKTHQIRAHLSSVGNFIIGDGKYGKNQINKQFNQKTQRLCSYKIKFNFKDGKLKYLDKKEIKLDNIPFI